MRALVCLLIVFGSILSATAGPVVVFVRHAEKTSTGGNDPDLSPAGLKRAEVLGQMLKDANIGAIFTSEFKRTQQTAAVAVKLFGIQPTVFPGNDADALVAKLRSLDRNALVVGHSNSIPAVVKALGIADPVTIEETDYDQILIVMLGDKPQLLRLRYLNG